MARRTKKDDKPVRTPLAKMLERMRHRHILHTVFGDFVEMAALAVSNRFDWSQYEEREARYMRIVKKYSKEEACEIAAMYGELALMLTDDPEQDALGKVAGDLELLSKGLGQFFTPFHVSLMMAMMTLQGAQSIVDANGFVSVMDPCCGAGGMIIAAAAQLRREGVDPTKNMHATLVDLDARCVHMAYLQLSILDVPAELLVANSLTLEVRERWYTPAHILGGWSRRLGPRAPREAAALAQAQLRWTDLSAGQRLQMTTDAGLSPGLALGIMPPAPLHDTIMDAAG